MATTNLDAEFDKVLGEMGFDPRGAYSDWASQRGLQRFEDYLGKGRAFTPKMRQMIQDTSSNVNDSDAWNNWVRMMQARESSGPMISELGLKNDQGTKLALAAAMAAAGAYAGGMFDPTVAASAGAEGGAGALTGGSGVGATGASAFPVSTASGAGITESGLGTGLGDMFGGGGYLEGAGGVSSAFDPVAAINAAAPGSIAKGVSSAELASMFGAGGLGGVAGTLATTAAVPAANQVLDGYGGEPTGQYGGPTGMPGPDEVWGQDVSLKDLFGNPVDALRRFGSDVLKNTSLRNVIDGGLEAASMGDYNRRLFGLMDKTLERSDPFYSQRGTYQGMLPGLVEQQNQRMAGFDAERNKFRDDYRGQYDQAQADNSRLERGYMDEYGNFRRDYDSMYGDYNSSLKRMFTDPNYWANDSLLQGLNKNVINDTSRALSAQGFNNSGNQIMELGQRLQNNMGQYVPAFQKSYTDAATGMLNNYGLTRTSGLNSLAGMYGNRMKTNTDMLSNYGNVGAQTLNAAVQGLNAGNNQLTNVGGFAGANMRPDTASMAQLGQLGANAQLRQYGALGSIFGRG